MEEIWLPIASLDGRYEASSHGRIRNGKTRKVLSGFTRSDGYWQVCLQDDSRKSGHRNFFVHQLVAEAFHGARPAGEQVRHYPDRDLNNNKPENLRYGSGSQNILDAIEHGTHYQARKTHCPQGHEYGGEDTYVAPDGKYRQCKICRRESGQRYYRRNREQRLARRRVRQDPDLLTTREAAEFIGSSRQHITNLCLRGELPFVQVGSHRRIYRQDLLAFIRH